MNGNVINLSSSTHQEIHKIFKDEIVPIVNQVDARIQNFKNYFVKEAAKFIRDFKSLAREADDSLDKIKIHVISKLSLIVRKKKIDTCIIKKEKEYAVLWNDWYKKCKESKYDKIAYDKAHKDMQQQIERLQDQLGDLKGVESTTRTKRPQPRNNPKNDKNANSEVVCAMCKQCLITVNHDVCVLNYVNDMDSRALNKNANVSNVEIQKKHKPKSGNPKR
ncbi:hypothetical protein Tco_0845612 [Tanacetum coccineum]